MGSPWRIDPTTHRTMSKRSYHEATSRSYNDGERRQVSALTRYNALRYDQNGRQREWNGVATDDIFCLHRLATASRHT